jgi:hypothetical protein
LLRSSIVDAKQGYGSFLTFEFGHPEQTRGLRRSANVHGEWHVWIYCCDWRFLSNGKQVAWSEDSKDQIARATGMIDGQKLLGLSVEPAQGLSRFEFDLGGLLETR